MIRSAVPRQNSVRANTWDSAEQKVDSPVVLEPENVQIAIRDEVSRGIRNALRQVSAHFSCDFSSDGSSGQTVELQAARS